MRLTRPIPLTAALALTVVGCGSDPLPYLGGDATNVGDDAGGVDAGAGGGIDDAGRGDGGSGSSDAGGGTDDGGGQPPVVDAGTGGGDTGGGTTDAGGGTSDANPGDAGTDDGGGMSDGGMTDAGPPREISPAVREAIERFCTDDAECLERAGYLDSAEQCVSYFEYYAGQIAVDGQTPGEACDAAVVQWLDCYSGYFNEDCSYDESIDCEPLLEAWYTACGVEYEYDDPVPPRP